MGSNASSRPDTSCVSVRQVNPSVSDAALTRASKSTEDTVSQRKVSKPTVIPTSTIKAATKHVAPVQPPTAAGQPAAPTRRKSVKPSVAAIPRPRTAATTTTSRPLGMHISAIRQFLREHPAIVAEDLTTSLTNRRFVRPETLGTDKAYIDTFKNQFDDNGNPLVAYATVFVSHAWKYSFPSTVVDVMEQHVESDPDAYFWFDMFTNNQNSVATKDFDWFSTTFKNSIRTIGQVLLVLSPWNDPKPLKRAWCLFEIASALDVTDVKFSINLPKSEIDGMSKAVVADSDCLIKALSDIQAEKAEATNAADKKLIFDVIDESEGGFYKVNEQVKKALRKWYCAQLRLLVESNPEDYNLLLAVSEISRDFGFMTEALSDNLACLKLAARHGLSDNYKRRVLHNLGNIHSDQGDLDMAIEYYCKSLALTLKTQGENHPDVAASYSNIGVIYDDIGDLEKALEYHTKALKIELRSYGDNHPNVATSYNNIAFVYSKLGALSESLRYHNKSLAIQQRILGENHPDTASSYTAIADIYNERQDHDVAIDYYKISLKITRVTLGEDHPVVADCYNNMANVYNDKGEHDIALEYYDKCLEILLENFDDDHPEIADCYSNMAVAYNKKGQYQLALEYQRKSDAIKEDD